MSFACGCPFNALNALWDLVLQRKLRFFQSELSLNVRGGCRGCGNSVDALRPNVAVSSRGDEPAEESSDGMSSRSTKSSGKSLASAPSKAFFVLVG